MILQSLTLENFRCFADATLTFDERVTMLVGENERGKSTILDAIAWGLLGRCRGTDARGVGSDTLIRQGQTSMRVALGVLGCDGQPGRVDVERSLTSKTSTLLVGGEVVKKDEQSARLYGPLGVTPAVIDACLHTDTFLRLHHADAKNLLLDVLDVWVPIDGEQYTLGQVEAMYHKAVEARKLAKQQLAAIKVPPAPEGDVPDLAALEAKLAELREEEKRRLAQSAKASGRAEEIDRQLAHLDTAIARTAAELERTAFVEGPDGEQHPIEDALAQIAARLERLTAEDEDPQQQELRVALVDAEGRLKLLQETHVALAQHNPTRGCVLNSEIPCKTPAKHFTAELASIQQQIDAIKAQQDAAQQAAEKARLRQADIRQLTRRYEELQRTLQARERQHGDLRDLQSTRERLQTERDQLPAVDAEPSDALATLQARIAKGEAVIREARELVAARGRYEEAKRQQAEAARKVAELEARCELLGPKGARAQALQSALGRFEATINQALGRFGYTLRIVAEPWLLLINDLPVELHSASAQLRIGVALQLALAEASGFGFVAIDQVDLLVGENRALFAEMLSLAAEHVQIVAAVSRDESYEPPSIEGWSWLRVRRLDGISQVKTCGQLEGVGA